ncbi:MAG: hypothetical protein EOP82_05995 [Variovorax sp.]|nr:MAG: hypothetical protein EOP82_05995 [Variovorax sp.]
MGTDIQAKAPLRQRAINELKELVVLTVYLFIVLGTVYVIKASVLHTHGIEVSYWGVAIVKALVLAKFVMLGKGLKVGEHHATGPLIRPTLRKSFAFLVLLIVLTIAEEIVKGWLHHHSIGDTLSDLFGPRLAETLAGILILLLVLLPYFAFQVLAEALGEGRLVRMFLLDRDAERRRS